MQAFEEIFNQTILYGGLHYLLALNTNNMVPTQIPIHGAVSLKISTSPVCKLFYFILYHPEAPEKNKSHLQKHPPDIY
jgi:hypothetical protein